MSRLLDSEIVVFFLSLGLLLGVARLLGQIAQRVSQPAVLGELLAGICLGPTILGNLAPDWQAYLFPATGSNAVALHAVTTLSIVLFLMVAGLEVDLSTIWRQGAVAIKVGTLGMLIPFGLAAGAAWLVPKSLGQQVNSDPWVFALFLGIAFSISALPVIARTLLDLDLYRTDLGMVVISAAILNDLIGWTAFAVVQGMIATHHQEAPSVPFMIVSTLGLAVCSLTVGRVLIHRVLPFIQAYSDGTGGVLGFAIVLGFLGAALSESLGIHAIFGAFLAGIAIGDSSHLRERTRVMMDQFISAIFAPLFFASIGLRIDFWSHFDGPLILTILLLACLGKLVGGTLGAYWGGLPHRQALAVGFALNARGAMEIILGLLALEAGLIRQRLFVALVVMAVVTSMMSGPAMAAILKLRQAHRLSNALSPRTFIPRLLATERKAAIHELAERACEVAGLSVSAIESAAWLREDALPTGLGNGVAVPHARVVGLKQPVVAVGLSHVGIDFDSPDGQPTRVVFLVLTPADQPLIQLQLSAEIAHMFRDAHLAVELQRIASFTEFLSLIKAHG